MDTSKDRKKLESLRLSLCHLAKQVGVESPLIEGSASDWEERTRTIERGWNSLIVNIMEKTE